MALVKTQLGWIEVICGSMFSGKSEELIRRLRRAIIAKQRVQIFKPRIDSRYADAEIVSHSEMRLPSLSVESSDELLEKLDHRTEVVGVDEAQFFDAGLIAAAGRMADQGKRVIVAGTGKDYRECPSNRSRRSWRGPRTSRDAGHLRSLRISREQHPRLVESDELVVVGAQGLYEARCRRCYEPPSRTENPPKHG